MDIKKVFLHCDLKEDIYVTQPDGFKAIDNMVYKLKKKNYDLKQSRDSGIKI